MFTREMEVVREQIRSLSDLLPMLASIEASVEKSPQDLDLLADVTFLCRKAEDMFDVIAKRFGQIEHKAAEAGCKTFSALPPTYKNYANDNCTISAKPGFYVKHPSSPTQEGYKEFIAKLPPECVRPHFPTIQETITQAIAEGGQIPFGLPEFGLMGPTYKLRLTAKKDL